MGDTGKKIVQKSIKIENVINTTEALAYTFLYYLYYTTNFFFTVYYIYKIGLEVVLLFGQRVTDMVI